MNGRWLMRTAAVVAFTAVVIVVLVAAPAASRDLVGESRASRVPSPDIGARSDVGTRGKGYEHARLETLWIFDADFEDLTGDNAGWTTVDYSGTAALENYWHKDTIRLTEAYLGDSTWWCGKYDSCWYQPRGYGNDWHQVMYRDLQLSTWSQPGDDVVLEFDQRFAMEHDYDYGYIDISDDGGGSWETIWTVNNPGFAGKPGVPKDWDSDQGHPSCSLSEWAGEDIRLRCRFESDEAYSAQDEYANEPWNSVQDGAWQLDNIEVSVNDAQVWLDDCESPGSNGWVHDDIPATGQTGITFWRGLYGTDFETGRLSMCSDPSGWMMAAVDPFTGVMVDGEYTWLTTPAIDISGADRLVGQWNIWVDLPYESNDRFDISIRSGDSSGCPDDWPGWGEPPGGWYGGPFWGTWSDDWDAFAGNDRLWVTWQLENQEPAPPGTHRAGIILNRQRVGIPTGDPGTSFTYGSWDRFHDWYMEEILQALVDSAVITAQDDDDVATVAVTATNDDGATWSTSSCRRLDPLGNDWNVPPPTDLMTAGSEIRYYFEAVDGVGNVAVYPADAPDETFEFSMLPITASEEEPGLLIVDKHARAVPGERRDHRLRSIAYYDEALSILGYAWDLYDVDVPVSIANSEGPIREAYDYYDTVMWITSDYDYRTFWTVDQRNVTEWLAEAGGGAERNLLVAGNDWAYGLVAAGYETLDFVTEWLAVEYIQNGVGDVLVDSMPTLREHAGGTTFMDADDGACVLAGGCPTLMYFDVLEPYPGSNAEIVVDYVKQDASELSAGVAYTNPTFGYQTVALGFGVEFMMDSLDPSTGYYNTGVADRVNLMQNIMAYFAKTPTTDPTGVVDDGFRNMLAHASPNPFNPVTRIAYSVRESGPVVIEVHNVAGRVVRTLLESELAAGTEGFVVWDGRNDAGESCASGVYFCRMVAPGFVESRKMVVLK